MCPPDFRCLLAVSCHHTHACIDLAREKGFFTGGSMTPDHGEPLYTPTELFDLYLQFIRDKDERQRILKYDISPSKDTSVIIHFIGFVRNHDYKVRMKEIDAELQRLKELSERRKSEVFGKPTDGKLFTQGGNDGRSLAEDDDV
jgi:hypothetical protein